MAVLVVVAVYVNSGEAATATDLDWRSQLARAWAPVIYQEAIKGYELFDRITRFDYDGDWIGENNWDNLGKPNTDISPTIYYWVVETDRYWFIGYGIFHPRDWGDWLFGVPIVTCESEEGVPPENWTNLSVSVGQACHENDMEGVLLVVDRQAGGFGALVGMLTVFHDKFKKYTVAEMNSLEFGRPRIYIEALSHAIEANRNWHSDGFSRFGAVGMVYRLELPEGIFATPSPSTPGGTDLFYSLTPIDEMWDRRFDEETFGDEANVIGNARKYFASDSGMHASPPWSWTASGVPPNEEFFCNPALTVSTLFGDLPGLTDQYSYNLCKIISLTPTSTPTPFSETPMPDTPSPTPTGIPLPQGSLRIDTSNLEDVTIDFVNGGRLFDDAELVYDKDKGKSILIQFS